MKSPVVLFCLFALLSSVGFLIPAWSDVLLFSLPCAMAALWLLWRAWRGADGLPADDQPRQTGSKSPGKSKNVKWVILDGSNVMYWKGGEPNLQPVRDVLARLKKKGFTAGVMFDANAGYKLLDMHQHDKEFSDLLGLPQDRIMVVPSGTPADPYILTAARDYGARIVTNDRFRDWASDFPEVRRRGFLITGKYRKNSLLLNLI